MPRPSWHSVESALCNPPLGASLRSLDPYNFPAELKFTSAQRLPGDRMLVLRDTNPTRAPSEQCECLHSSRACLELQTNLPPRPEKKRNGACPKRWFPSKRRKRQIHPSNERADNTTSRATNSPFPKYQKESDK